MIEIKAVRDAETQDGGFVNRQVVLDLFQQAIDSKSPNLEEYWKKLIWVKEHIQDLPSVNPQKWIPVSDRLPEENEAVLLGVRYKDDFKYFVTMRCDYNYWTGIGRDLKGIGYWMPLPQPMPYKGVEE